MSYFYVVLTDKDGMQVDCTESLACESAARALAHDWCEREEYADRAYVQVFEWDANLSDAEAPVELLCFRAAPLEQMDLFA